MPISDSEIKTLRKTTKLQRDSLLTAAANLLKQSRDQEAEFALARADDLNQRLRSLPRITKVKTPPIYGPDSPHSFVLDAVASTGRCAAFGMPSQQEAQARQNLYYEFDANKEVWASSPLTDIHHQGHGPGKDVQNGDHGAEEATPSPSVLHPGVQG